MSAGHLAVRIGAAAALITSLLVFGPTAAHAGSPIVVTGTLQCDPIPGSSYDTANWHVHLENNTPGPNGVLFILNSESDAQAHYLTPGQSMDLVVIGRDGLGTFLTISADGTLMLNKTDQQACNPVTTDAQLVCPPGGGWPYILYSMTNPSPSTYNFTVDEHNGLQFVKQITASSATVTETLFEGQHYHGTITLVGNVLKDIEGDANCQPQQTTTTTSTTSSTSTTIASTTTTSTTIPATTTSTVPATDPPTTTTVPHVHIGGGGDPTTEPRATDPPADPPSASTPHHAAAAPVTSTTAPTGQLPFTGSTTAPLAALGFACLALGALALSVLRRRREVNA